ncbi:hypothetical protein C7M84_009069 [Penaeus vannamei]|uniref:Uncharacterized protein n=1 Tax=Penaeus vannamei TaxID=6689 RepID=A0A423T7V7_PENVA|nr:hypothetical protein C7M84_009069 [Penaeus vannamei]
MRKLKQDQRQTRAKSTNFKHTPFPCLSLLPLPSSSLSPSLLPTSSLSPLPSPSISSLPSSTSLSLSPSLPPPLLPFPLSSLPSLSYLHPPPPLSPSSLLPPSSLSPLFPSLSILLLLPSLALASLSPLFPSLPLTSILPLPLFPSPYFHPPSLFSLYVLSPPFPAYIPSPSPSLPLLPFSSPYSISLFTTPYACSPSLPFPSLCLFPLLLHAISPLLYAPPSLLLGFIASCLSSLSILFLFPSPLSPLPITSPPFLYPFSSIPPPLPPHPTLLWSLPSPPLTITASLFGGIYLSISIYPYLLSSLPSLALLPYPLPFSTPSTSLSPFLFSSTRSFSPLLYLSPSVFLPSPHPITSLRLSTQFISPLSSSLHFSPSFHFTSPPLPPSLSF